MMRRLLLIAVVLACAVGTAGAATLTKVTWSTGDSISRVNFHFGRALTPDIIRASDRMLRVDLKGTDASAVPSRLDPRDGRVEKIQRLPERARPFLPEGVTARFLVTLADPKLSFSFEETTSGFRLLVGSAVDVGVPTVRETAATPREPALGTGLGELPERTTTIELEGASRDETLPQPLGFRPSEDLVVRAGPSSLHAQVGTVPAGRTAVAVARRGAWLHLAGGGWVAHGLPVGAEHAHARRRAMAWSIVTLGTGLAISVREALPGQEPGAAAIARLFAQPVTLARVEVRATSPTSYGFRLPGRAGRVKVTLKNGVIIESLDPRDLTVAAGVTSEVISGAFDSPEILPGQVWKGWVLLPPGLDFQSVEDVRFQVGRRQHRLLVVPGSGEPVR
ncbi:MAG: hypothetical protein AAF533_21270 [Acidobacteriota bacterium]